MTFGQAIQTCFRKYADFTGRASRPEYWWFILFTALVSAALGIVGSVTALGSLAPLGMYNMMGGRYGGGYSGYGTSTLSELWSLAVLLPSLAVAVRRLRDSGRSWGNLFWILLPSSDSCILIVPALPAERHGRRDPEPPAPAA
ncbi:MAG: DUF805 domain-containing protein [Galbitalea sp.]